VLDALHDAWEPLNGIVARRPRVPRGGFDRDRDTPPPSPLAGRLVKAM